MSGSLRNAAWGGGVVAASAVVGAALCLMKGDGDGLLEALGNASAPYAIVAVLAGLATRRVWVAALLGIAATEAIVGGFYWAYANLEGHEVARALLLWSTAGLPCGVTFGIAGCIAVRRPAMRYVIPALLLLEPAAVAVEPFLLPGFGHPDKSFAQLEAFAIEIAIGVPVLLVVRQWVLGARRSRASTSR